MNVRAYGTCLCFSMALTTTGVFAQADGDAIAIEQREFLQDKWGGSIESSSQLADELSRASAQELAAALEASTIEEFLGALDSNCNVETENWTYTAVEPCRAADTRKSTVNPGPVLDGTTRDFFVWGSGVAGQNGGAAAGNPDDCPAPDGEPRAVHINVTAVPSWGNGHFRVYPAGIATPGTSFINFRQGVNIANAGSVKTRCEIGGAEIEVFARTQAHLIIDVMGYYYDTPDPVP